MTNTTILILGGKGKTGRHVTERLQARGVQTRLASRSSARRFDWYDEDTWEPVTTGIDTAYMAPPVDPPGMMRAERFIRQAAANGLRRLVLLSGRGVGSPGREFEVYEKGLELENAVKDSGLDWTIVRPAWFMQNFSEDFFYDSVMAGELRVSAGDGAEPWIDTEDIAEVMVAALLDPKHIGETYSLSGPRTLTMTEVASELTAAIGRPIRYVELEPEEHVAELVGYGAPREVAESLRDLLAVIRNHRSEYLSDGVRQVLGREPRDFADWARRTARTGAWSA
ncbi:NAD(P)H-binding protein [Glycomyces tenuis]|uniref:NAD(P)H-binding protein n=1 Tax=Glycomyces tenuis TaxID=58116 RepID=UPI00041F3B31|nr:NAD(P)H-binding protein [Glycomyces tenuis]